MEIEKLLHEYKNVDENYLKKMNFSSFLIPESVTREEIIKIYNIFQYDNIFVCVYEFGGIPKKYQSTNLNEACDLMDEYNFFNIITEINENIYIWQPDHHEFSLIFGDRESINIIKAVNIFEYSFNEYKNENVFSKESRNKFDLYQKRYVIL